MATHFTELEHALKMLTQLTGISLDVKAENEEEAVQALTQVQRLITAYREKYNHSNFLHTLLLEDLPLSTILEESRRLHLTPEEPRVLFLLETRDAMNDSVIEILRQLFPTQSAKALIPVSENQLAVAYTLAADRMSTSGKSAPKTDVQIQKTAHMIVDTLSAEALVSVRLAYSPCFDSLTRLHAMYEETALTLRIGSLFYPEQSIFCADRLGVGRLIIQLPRPVCERYLKEIWGSADLAAMDEEIMATVDCFLQNNLNIAETARQLHMHRNTLIYRISQVQKQTGLDLRNFEDAMQFKIAEMIRSFLCDEMARL